MKGGLGQTYLDNLTTGYARGQIIWVIYMVILTSMGLGGIPGPQFFFVNFLSLYMNSILREEVYQVDNWHCTHSYGRIGNYGKMRRQIKRRVKGGKKELRILGSLNFSKGGSNG